MPSHSKPANEALGGVFIKTDFHTQVAYEMLSADKINIACSPLTFGEAILLLTHYYN